MDFKFVVCKMLGNMHKSSWMLSEAVNDANRCSWILGSNLSIIESEKGWLSVYVLLKDGKVGKGELSEKPFFVLEVNIDIVPLFVHINIIVI